MVRDRENSLPSRCFIASLEIRKKLNILDDSQLIKQTIKVWHDNYSIFEQCYVKYLITVSEIFLLHEFPNSIAVTSKEFNEGQLAVLDMYFGPLCGETHGFSLLLLRRDGIYFFISFFIPPQMVTILVLGSSVGL